MPLCYEHLTRTEREIIAIKTRKGWGCRRIARELGRSPSTVCRELGRNSCPRAYHAQSAHRQAMQRRAVPRRPRLLDIPWRRRHLGLFLRMFWSPEQVSGRIRGMASKSTIYRMINTQRRRWQPYLRGSGRRTAAYERIRNRKMIDQRPSVVELKNRIGDWEADTVRGPMKSPACVMTLVERRSGYLVARLLKDRSADTLNKAMVEALHAMPVHTITVDNGMEFAKFRVLEDALGTQVYFAHERCPWERGLNENTNGLLRQFFPKGTDFSTISQIQLDLAVSLLNSRPRKSRNYQTPEEVIAA